MPVYISTIAVAIAICLSTTELSEARAAEPLASPPPCSDRVRALADAISDKPEEMELKRMLARAAVMCSDGRNEDANRLLTEAEKKIRDLKQDQHLDSLPNRQK